MNRNIRVLVVDDDRDIRNSVSRIVQTYFEATVVMGLDGKDGLREFSESNPDLVITDLEMEDRTTGFRLAREIKKLAPLTKVILVSGSLPSNIDDFEFFYLDRALPKPFRVSDLVSAIEQLGFKRKR